MSCFLRPLPPRRGCEGLAAVRVVVTFGPCRLVDAIRRQPSPTSPGALLSSVLYIFSYIMLHSCLGMFKDVAKV